tara:strand:- start:87 stop:512 length:426 start_codon:yes stop_codon:yes gene_type:complete
MKISFKYKNKNDLKQKATDRATDFLRTKYDFCDELEKFIAETKLWFTNARRAFYYSHKRTAKIALGGNNKWYTYDRKTVGKTSNGIVVPELLLVTLTIIHELTHAIQHFEKRKFSEVETTQNEIEYVKIVSPSTLAFLKKI